MKFAYPINDKGVKIGEIQSFPDMIWEKIIKQKVLRWVLVEDPRIVSKTEVKKKKYERNSSESPK